MVDGSAFIVDYPDRVIVPGTLTQCQAVYGTTSEMTCVVNSGSRTILITSKTGEKIPTLAKGSSMTFRLGPITNPET